MTKGANAIGAEADADVKSCVRPRLDYLSINDGAIGCIATSPRQYTTPYNKMAVSRNIMMRASRAFALGSSRTFATSRIAVSAPRQALFQPVKSTSIFASTRAYSSEAPTSAVEPPDYLDENELKVFNKLKEALKPERLEV